MLTALLGWKPSNTAKWIGKSIPNLGRWLTSSTFRAAVKTERAAKVEAAKNEKLELRPGGKMRAFEISSLFGQNKIVGFVSTEHLYLQFELTCAKGTGSNTQVTLTTKSAPRSDRGPQMLKALKSYIAKAVDTLLPGVKKADPNYPAVLPVAAKGFRQPSQKKLEKQGLLPDQVEKRNADLLAQSQVPRVEIPKRQGLGKLFSRSKSGG